MYDTGPQNQCNDKLVKITFIFVCIKVAYPTKIVRLEIKSTLANFGKINFHFKFVFTVESISFVSIQELGADI